MAALLDAHVAECPGCGAVAAAMEEIRSVLPVLSEIDPGTDFTAAVVRNTTGAVKAPRRTGSSAKTSFGAWWDALLARPRLSLELAYVATVLAVVLAGNPILVADSVAARATTLVADATSRVTSRLEGREHVSRIETAQRELARWIETARGEVGARRTAAAKGWDWVVQRGIEWWKAAQTWLSDVARGVAAAIGIGG